ncbi:hypothetical protein [Corynebacterium sp. AOP12-C2-36]|uniref:hypothetical protein n=1 Tax=Corynebacterium sp. AOP12-C2-36 TaxID=3457723 RepID=UPI0040339573
MSTTPQPTATLPVTASSPDTAPAADNTTEPMWIPVSKLIIGVLVVLAALTFSEHIAEPISDYGYVPVMFFYVIVMIIGGALMVSGFMTLWRKATTPSNPQQ